MARYSLARPIQYDISTIPQFIAQAILCATPLMDRTDPLSFDGKAGVVDIEPVGHKDSVFSPLASSVPRQPFVQAPAFSHSRIVPSHTQAQPSGSPAAAPTSRGIRAATGCIFL